MDWGVGENDWVGKARERVLIMTKRGIFGVGMGLWVNLEFLRWVRISLKDFLKPAL